MADVCSSPWVVVAEPIIIKSRLNVLILPLVLERNEGGFIVARPLPSEDVKFLLPYLVALLINRGDNAATRNRLSLTIIEN
ncbi:hypothetical protein HMPREF9144_2110 [Prevotella pallens ATCC 700821]|uniref:Uncharacterized protein n=1 Tax=Prevotella pallens ATCC 700821 TaxID=997353 RepID=F9DKB8_9BACT|nr:hypothetical protein HMPREF9144_2110 [Prevotella pallens ATCC 700821]